MLTFDSFTLIPAFSDIKSRKEVDLSITINNIKSSLPIINANMHSICSNNMVYKLSNEYNSFSSFHRFFSDNEVRKNLITIIKSNLIDKNKFFASVGVQRNDYEFIDWLYANDIKNIIVDVNHGHHQMVRDVIKYAKNNYKDIIVMAGNVSSTDGIRYLKTAGADIIKIGNSFGSSCSTLLCTAVGVHPIHVAKTYREYTNDEETILCLDGGIRNVADIAKCLVWGDMVMVGKMFAGTDESNGECIYDDKGFVTHKKYYGNASIITKSVSEDENHIRYIEGKMINVPYVGTMNNVLNSIVDGLQSSLSFMGAKNVDEFRRIAPKQVLILK